MKDFEIDLLEGWKHPHAQYYKSWDLASKLAGFATGRKECCTGLSEGEASFLVHYGLELSLIQKGKESKEDYVKLVCEVNQMLINNGFAREFEGVRENYLIKEVISKLQTAQKVGAKLVPGDIEQIQELLAVLEKN